MDKVSIVVPVYNKEKDVKKCINSLVRQSYRDIEIVIIDDGSTDNSYDICNKYAKRDSRVKVFAKENEGVEIARIYGIEKSTGTYITFVDSDDWLSENAIEVMISSLKAHEADVSIINFCRVIGSRGIVKKKNKDDIYNNQLITQQEFIEKHLQAFCGWDRFPINVWGKLYKRELLQDIKLSGLTYGEDLCMNLQVLPKAKKIVTNPEGLYYYRYGGITTNIKDSLFDNAISQYLFKIQYFRKFKRDDCIEMANVELCNFFITFVDNIMLKYSNIEAKEKISIYISNTYLQQACRNISYDRFKKSDKYMYIKEQDIDALIKSRRKFVSRNKMKKRFISHIQKFL